MDICRFILLLLGLTALVCAPAPFPGAGLDRALAKFVMTRLRDKIELALENHPCFRTLQGEDNHDVGNEGQPEHQDGSQ